VNFRSVFAILSKILSEDTVVREETQLLQYVYRVTRSVAVGGWLAAAATA